METGSAEISAQSRVAYSPLRVNLRPYFLFVVSLVVLRASAEFVYMGGLTELYAYRGFVVDVEPARYMLSWIIYILLACTVPSHAKQVSFVDTGYVLLFIIYFMPAMVLFGVKETAFWPQLTLYYISLAIAFKIVARNEAPKTKRQRLRRMNQIETRKNTIIFATIGLLFFLVTFYVWARYANFHIQLDLLDVYGLRLEAREYGMPQILKYAYAAVSVITPFFIVWSLSVKRWTLTSIFMLTQVICFFIDGSKSTIFSMVLGIAMYCLLLKDYGRIRYIIFAFILVFIAAEAFYVIFGFEEIIGVFVRRVFFVPAGLNYSYYEFFSLHPLALYLNTFNFIPGIEPIYNSGLGGVVGSWASAGTGLNANNGLFSDAFGNLGTVGCVIMPFAIAIVMKVMDKASEGIEKPILIVPIFLVAMAYGSAGFFTSFLSHGVVPLMLLLYFMPRSNSEDLGENVSNCHSSLLTSKPTRTVSLHRGRFDEK